MSINRSLTAALGAVLLVGVTASPAAAAGPPEVFEDPFAFTGPDLDNGLVVFINTSREAFCTDEQVAREVAIVDWFEGGMVDPFPEWALERPAGFETWTPNLIDSPKGVIANLDEGDQHIELWWLDEPEDSFGVGACLDTDDRLELFATGSAEIKANASDLFEGGLRSAAIDHFRGKADLIGVDGNDYAYSFSWRLVLPCDEPPGRPCEVTNFSLAQR
ncbi:hypothetical protein [Agromyces binzhouensis]|uniref:Uncharacterized protein n=1 Tax=Agromyces binzhouensis TaxID=1817495 RepID=A0A4Q2JP56_9MICO|nr:hypothetical protein [Agromyces binzhouensis]RXZ50021.1 hypothetical protein ESO86_04070 [Agromyces binzhouensis]